MTLRGGSAAIRRRVPRAADDWNKTREQRIVACRERPHDREHRREAKRILEDERVEEYLWTIAGANDAGDGQRNPAT